MSDTKKKESKKETNSSCCEDFKKMCGTMENCCDSTSGKFDCKTMMEKCCGDQKSKG